MTEIIKRGKSIQCMSAGSLKLIAIVTMLIDHFMAGIFAPIYTSGYFTNADILKCGVIIYDVGRSIGRFAFPVFCFLLVEGFFYTKSRMKYMCNLVIFALVSEVPFDLLLKQKIDFTTQNVFFTLAISLAVIWGIDQIRKYLDKEPVIALFFQGMVILAGCLIAYGLHTDYTYRGVVLALIFYYYRNNRFLACLVGYVWLLSSPWCITAFIAVLFYNGKRGIGLKYFFYVFYPVHLLLLYGLRVWLLGY